MIIPNDDSPVIDRTLASLGAQTMAPARFEVIVVGRDRSGLVEASERVRFIRTAERLMPGAARNVGAADARGEVLAFLDADCLAPADWLDRHLSYHRREVCVVGGGVRFDGDDYWTLVDNVSLFHEFHASCPAGRRRYLPSLNLSVARPALEQVGGFDPALRSAEDLDLTARLALRGYPLYFAPEAAVWHQPVRRGWRDVWGRFSTYGRNSLRVRRRYPSILPMPHLLRRRPVLLAAAPAVAAALTLKIFAVEPAARPYWRTAPGVFLTKLAWCLSAATWRDED